MSLLTNEELKEKKKILDLEQKIKREKKKLDKKLTRQKIILGAFCLDLLEKDKFSGLREYTADNLEPFLTRESDKKLFEEFIENLKANNKNNSEEKPKNQTVSQSENSQTEKNRNLENEQKSQNQNSMFGQ